MKKEHYFFITLIAIALFSCNANRHSGALTVIDTSKRFPEKTLVLQEIAQVEYIALETTDDFLTDDSTPRFIDDNIIVMTVRQTGEVLIFDRKTGKGISKFNRLGRSGQEYLSLNNLTADYESGEIFIQGGERILVYDMQGGFKRVFELPGSSISAIFTFDRGNLICYDYNATNSQPCFLIDKTDGGITHEFVMPIGDTIALPIRAYFPRAGVSGIIRVHAQCVKTYNGYVIGKPALDTLYALNSLTNRVVPMLVHASHILTIEPADFNLLTVLNETRDMIFLEAMKININFDPMGGNSSPFTNERLVYLKDTGECFVQKVINADYEGWESYVNRNSGDYPAGTACFVLSAYDLHDANGSGRLRGELGAVASGIVRDDNPVLAIVNFR